MNIDISLKILSHKWKFTIAKTWVQLGLMMLVILLSMVVSYWGSPLMLILVPVLLGGIGVLMALLKQIHIGFILLLMAAIFVPFSGPGGVNAAVLMVAGLIGLWFMDMFVVKRSFEFIKSRALLPVIIFVIISIISFAMGQIPWFLFAKQAPLDAQIGGFAMYILSLGLMLVAAHLFQDIKWLEVIVWVFLGLGAIYIFGRALHIPFIDQVYQGGFTRGSMYWTWLITLAFSQFIFNNQLKRSIRGLLLVIVIVTFYVAIVQGYDWKSGWFPPLVAVAIILLLRFPRLLILVIPMAVIVAGFLVGKLISSDSYSWGTRVDAWVIILKISQESPLFGLGFSNYYWYTPLFPIRGWPVSFNSHSQYIDLIAQVGLLGLLCFFWVFLGVGRVSWDLRNRFPDGFARAYINGVLAGVVATLVAAFLVDWVLPFVYNIGFNGFRASILPWLFFGGLISLEQIYQTTQKQNH